MRKRRPVHPGARCCVAALLAACCLVIAPRAVEARGDGAPDWRRVKREWLRLSAAEREAYAAIVRARARQAARGPVSPAAAESCSGAGEEIGALPFSDSASTAGAADDVNLGASGMCAGGGNGFPETGSGPDLVYALRTDQTCDLQLTLTPTGPNDLALYVLSGCANVAASCFAVEDTGIGGQSESLVFTAAGSALYYVVVDGWMGDAGPFRLDVAEAGSTGCMLVPVEVQSFSVE